MEPLIVPGVLDSLSTIREYVLRAATAAGLERRQSYRLCLAVDELATNIVTYAYDGIGIAGEIVVQALIDEHALTITIEDSAQPFDPAAQVLPDDFDLPLEQRKIGGLGIYLALDGVDKFIHEFTGRGNRNTLVINR